jgi:molybdopterin synthase sulfur carrier subunit
MPLDFVIPGPLRELAGKRGAIHVDRSAASVAEALEILWREAPALRDRVMTERGEIRPHVNVFVGTESIRDLDGLRTALDERAEIVILPAVSGG